MYSITDAETFEDLQNKINVFERAKDADITEIPVYLVGNKVDLANDERCVPTADMHVIAKKNGFKCTEATAKDYNQVVQVYEELALMVLKKRAFDARKENEQSVYEKKMQSTDKNGKKCITM